MTLTALTNGSAAPSPMVGSVDKRGTAVSEGAAGFSAALVGLLGTADVPVTPAVSALPLVIGCVTGDPNSAPTAKSSPKSAESAASAAPDASVATDASVSGTPDASALALPGAPLVVVPVVAVPVMAVPAIAVPSTPVPDLSVPAASVPAASVSTGTVPAASGPAALVSTVSVPPSRASRPSTETTVTGSAGIASGVARPQDQPAMASLPAALDPKTLDSKALDSKALDSAGGTGDAQQSASPESVPLAAASVPQGAASASAISALAISAAAMSGLAISAPVGVTPAGAAPAGAAQTAPSAAGPSALASQLATPIFSLQHAGAGEHIVTVTVSPEALGPVTVRAHVDAAGMRVELFAPTEAGRDAIRSILGDLKRDLAGHGLSSTLDLSSQNQPSDRRNQGAERGAGEPATVAVPSGPDPSAAGQRPTIHRHTSTLDVLA